LPNTFGLMDPENNCVQRQKFIIKKLKN